MPIQRILWVSNRQFSRGFPDWATLRGAWPLAYADSRMKDFLLILVHLAVVAAKLCGHGGVRSVMAENLVLKQQLIVLRRGRRFGLKGHHCLGRAAHHGTNMNIGRRLSRIVT
jgi:hypothetical protein